jgi:hypothetical protein
MTEIDKRSELKNLCAKTAVKYGYKEQDLNVGLELFAIDALALTPEIHDSMGEFFDESQSPDLSEFHTGKANDGGIDGILYNLEELNKVIVIQTKYKQGKVDASTAAEARDFFSRISEWADPQLRSRLNSKTQDLLDDCEFNPQQQEITLYFITSQTSSEVPIDTISQIETQNYRDLGWDVTCVFLTSSDFLRLHKELTTAKIAMVVEEVVFSVNEDYLFEYDGGDYLALVCAIKGNELSNIYHRPGVGDNLFNTNIRSALKKGTINKEIARTAESKDGAEKFFFYNNGVSATCTDYEFIADNKIKAINLQIVNGAQTVSSISRVLKAKPNPNLYVMLRLIATHEKYGHKTEFANKLIRFQNTQNPVKDSDFFSNDDIQVWIAANLPKMTEKSAIRKFWYEHKRGVEPSTSKGKKLGMEDLGLLRYACLHDAPFTYKLAKEIWSSSENTPNYWIAFGSEAKKCDSWSQEELAEAAWMINCMFAFKEEHEKVKKLSKESNIPMDETKYLGVLSRYLTAATFAGMNQLKTLGVFSSYLDLIGSKDHCDKIQNEVMSIARDYLQVIYPTWTKRVANPRLNLAQDATTWDELKNHMASQVTTKLSRFTQ